MSHLHAVPLATKRSRVREYLTYAILQEVSKENQQAPAMTKADQQASATTKADKNNSHAEDGTGVPGTTPDRFDWRPYAGPGGHHDGTQWYSPNHPGRIMTVPVVPSHAAPPVYAAGSSKETKSTIRKVEKSKDDDPMMAGIPSRFHPDYPSRYMKNVINSIDRH